MLYIEYEGASTELQGTSFNRTLGKKDKSVWESNNTAVYVLKDSTGATVLNNSVPKTADNLGFSVDIGYDDTEALSGEYILVIYLTDTIDLEFKVPIGIYILTYSEISA